jgi:tRNA(Ile)-lysidine synthase
MHSPELIIYNLLYNYSFSPTTISDIFNSLYSQPGKKFYSTTHTLIKDRKYFLLSESKNKTNKEKLITAKTKKISTPISLSFSTIPSPLKYSNNPNIALIDIKKIIFPLKVRKWKKGDYFIPLGMKGKKKLSDFFIDQKISLNKKQETYVIESGGEIVWVIGFRISEKFKLTGNSSDALKIQFENID